MARLYDYIMAGRLGDHRFAIDTHALRRAAADTIADVPVIVMDNVARYYYQDDPKDIWSLENDFPNVAPPLENVWIEFSSGTTMNKNGRISRVDGCYAGWHMRANKHDKGWEVRATLYFGRAANKPQGPITDVVYGVTLDGSYVPRHPEGLRLEVAYGSELNDEEREGTATTASNLLKPVFLGLSFMHCKNVEVRSAPPSPLIERKPWTKKHGRPLVRYHVLDIDPMRKVLKHEGRSDQVGLKKALHICRGHFATYTEDAPLFGRITGTFWKPQHVRGSAKHGAVVKDYNVKAPRK
jgi:hypothetical protein